jgi:hypothetical protein|tara:strand:+ start:5225 stop:6043 length:819 start_codon:yes stop_codon:yes gene_type:complete
MSKRVVQLENAAAFNRTLAELGREAKKSAAEILLQQAKLLVKDCIKLTPPTSGKGKEMSVSLKTQEQVGKRRVERDINKVVGALQDLDLWRGSPAKKAINKAIKAGDFKAAADILGHKKKKSKVAESIPKDYHKRFHNSRGRVTNPSERLYVTSRGAKKAYIQEAQQSVMKGKAGWKKAARKLGVKGLVSSITKHNAAGMALVAAKPNNPTPKITVANLVSHIQAGGQALRVMEYAMKNRTRAMRQSLQEMYGRKAKRAIKKWTTNGRFTPR